jgi:uncharacterized membrane protein
LIFAGAALLHFAAFQSAHVDLGTMTQAVWSSAHGHILEMTNVYGHNVTRFAYHIDPLLVLFVPLWWIWSSGAMLVTVQAVAVAAGALPVYWLARKHLGTERSAAHFAFAYLLFPATQFNAFTISSGFHAVALAVPLLLYAICFLDEDLFIPFSVVALLALTTKEEIGAAIGCLGLWYAVRHKRRVVGSVIFVVGFGVTLFNFLVLIPHYSPTGASPFQYRYAKVGTTPTGMLHTAIADPLTYVHTVATWHKLLYVVLLLGPFLGIWLREPLLFLCAVPDLMINLLSSLDDQTSIAYHWTAGVIPFTIAATIFGVSRLRRNPDKVSLWILLAVASIALFSPIYLGRGDLAAVLRPNPERAAKSAALSLVPPAAPVTASNQLGAYVAARRYSAIFPAVGRAEWAIVDRNDPTYLNAGRYRRAVQRLGTNPRWHRVYESSGIEVFRKRLTPG